MAATNDTPIQTFVARLVDQATERLTTSANDAQARQAALTKAKKDAGNRLRSEDIRVAQAAEDQLATEAGALAKRMTAVQASMGTDLERLVAVSRGV